MCLVEFVFLQYFEPPPALAPLLAEGSPFAPLVRAVLLALGACESLEAEAEALALAQVAARERRVTAEAVALVAAADALAREEDSAVLRE